MDREGRCGGTGSVGDAHRPRRTPSPGPSDATSTSPRASGLPRQRAAARSSSCRSPSGRLRCHIRSAAAHRHAGRSPSTSGALDEPEGWFPPRVPSSRLGRRVSQRAHRRDDPSMAQSRRAVARDVVALIDEGARTGIPAPRLATTVAASDTVPPWLASDAPEAALSAEMVELATATVPDVWRWPIPSVVGKRVVARLQRSRVLDADGASAARERVIGSEQPARVEDFRATAARCVLGEDVIGGAERAPLSMAAVPGARSGCVRDGHAPL